MILMKSHERIGSNTRSATIEIETRTDTLETVTKIHKNDLRNGCPDPIVGEQACCNRFKKSTHIYQNTNVNKVTELFDLVDWLKKAGRVFLHSGNIS